MCTSSCNLACLSWWLFHGRQFWLGRQAKHHACLDGLRGAPAGVSQKLFGMASLGQVVSLGLAATNRSSQSSRSSQSGRTKPTNRTRPTKPYGQTSAASCAGGVLGQVVWWIPGLHVCRDAFQQDFKADSDGASAQPAQTSQHLGFFQSQHPAVFPN